MSSAAQTLQTAISSPPLPSPLDNTHTQHQPRNDPFVPLPVVGTDERGTVGQ